MSEVGDASRSSFNSSPFFVSGARRWSSFLSDLLDPKDLNEKAGSTGCSTADGVATCSDEKKLSSCCTSWALLLN